jgi:hypothetical protein
MDPQRRYLPYDYYTAKGSFYNRSRRRRRTTVWCLVPRGRLHHVDRLTGHAGAQPSPSEPLSAADYWPKAARGMARAPAGVWPRIGVFVFGAIQQARRAQNERKPAAGLNRQARKHPGMARAPAVVLPRIGVFVLGVFSRPAEPKMSVRPPPD